MGDAVPPGIRLGIVRSISYGLFAEPDEFVPQLRQLGATLVRVFFFWSQVEPERAASASTPWTRSWSSSTAPRRSG